MKRRKQKNRIRKIIGFSLLPLGILGGFLPFMPGAIFFIAGLTLISDKFSKEVKTALRRYRCHRKISKFLKEMYKGFVKSFIKKDDNFSIKNYNTK